MNASDIIKAKQNRTLYKAYYRPTIFNSTSFSTVYVGSTISQVSDSQFVISTANYTSCNTNVNTYVCNPTFISYQFANDIKNGSYECGLKKYSELQWKNTHKRVVYFNSTIYSTSIISTQVNKYCPELIISSIVLANSTVANNETTSTFLGSEYKVNYELSSVLTCDYVYTSTIVPSSTYITSSIAYVAPEPIICPLITMYQGTSYLNRCNKCNTFLTNQGYCCEQCM